MVKTELAVIGGSGLYGMADLADVKQVDVATPYGRPSDAITLGTLQGRQVAFLPRHGRGHTLTPSEVPYRANIYALKSLGVRYIVAVSACGSLREDYRPGDVVVPDQLVDFTKGRRASTFFDGGLVAHVSVAEPFSPELSLAVAGAVRTAGGRVHQGGAYITIEGPRFSTKGESNLYRQWGMSIIGMTTSPEAFLAAEAEIAYACMAHVTDYDTWHEAEEPVTVEMVTRVLKGNTSLAQQAIRNLVDGWAEWSGDFLAHACMEPAFSLIGDWTAVDPQVRQTLQPIIAKYTAVARTPQG
jgi:5'-methylthioadenosine phosphorylase